MARLGMRYEALRLTAVIALTLFGAVAGAQAATTVDIHPGANIPSVVSANPAGTTFVIYPGTYRLSGPINPKNGDVFSGEATCAPPKTSCTAILSGAKVLTSFTHTNNYYSTTGQTQQGMVSASSSVCVSGYDGCIYPEDLYYDNTPLEHVTALSDLATGKWYFDYSSNTIYMYDNPSGHTVEASVVPYAFEPGPANNVTIKDLTFEKFASPLMMGAVGGAGTGLGSTTEGANWIVENNEIRLSHADGVRVNFGWQVLNNYIHNNGNLGIGGGLGGGNSDGSGTASSNILVQGNEVSYNNYAQVNDKFGAGGAKFTNTRNLVLRDNYVHNNVGDGLHTDIGNYNTLFDNNTIADNTGDGIFHEISYSAIARNNKLQRNGYIYPNGTFWLYGANLLSSTSQGLEAYCNTVEVSAEGGNGIDIISQTRSGYTSSGNYFHHNTVTFDGNSGSTGAANNPNQTNFFTSNRFDNNTYHFPNLSIKSFAWSDKWYTFAGFEAAGQDSHGSADTKYTSSVPQVALTAPLDGASTSGTVAITGTAQDTNTISKVEFYVDWTLKATDGGGDTFNFTWNTTGVAAGSHVLAAMAYTPEGIRACYAVTVTVP